jgi:TP901 family phage tail tape measure protein
MPLPKIGVEAVVDNLDGYKKAMKAVDTANENAGKGVEATAKKFNVLMFAADALGDTMQQAFGNIIGGVVLGALNAVGNLIGGLIGRIQGLVSSIFNAGVEFSKTMANISSVTKLTGSNLTQLGKDLIDIGADSAAGPQAVAAAYYDVASGVLDASKRMDVLRASIALSEAGQADLTASTQGLISVMNAYGDASGGATRVSDVFTATVASGVGTMDQFVGAMSPLAGLAAGQKISFEELGGAISYMTAKGIPAERAATEIQAAIVQLSRSTPQVTRALRAMGEKSVAASISAHGLAGTLALLEKGAKKTGQNFTQMIGSVEALQAANALGTEEFQKYFDTFIDGVDGATAAARDLQRADVSYQLKLMNSRFQAVGLSIAGAVLPAFNKFLSFVNNAFKNFDWKKIGAGFDKLGEKLGQTAEKIIGNIAEILSGVDWEQVATDISNAISSIGDWIASIDWTAVIQGTKDFVVWLGNAASEVGKFIAGIDFAAIGAAVQGAFDFIGKLFGEIKTSIDNFGIGWGVLSGQVSQAFTDIGNTVTTAYDNITGGFAMIGDGLSIIWGQWFGPTGSVSTAVSDAFTSIGTFITTGQTNVTIGIQAIVDAVTGIWDYYFGAEGQISQAVSNAFTSVQQFIDDALSPVQTAIQGVIDAVTTVWDGLFGPAGSISTTVTSALNEVVRIVNGIVGGVRAAFNAISNAITSALAPAKAVIDALVSGISAISAFTGGGNSGAPGGASGGNLQEGLNIVGERGAEAVIKAGNKVTVIPHDKSRAILASVGNNITPLPKGGGLNPAKYIPKLNFSSLASSVSGIMPQATPIMAGGGSSYNNETTNNRNIGSIVFNGVDGAQSAISRLSMLKAAKKF